MYEGYDSELWQKLWLQSHRRRWSSAEATVESITKILAENGITTGKIFDICCGIGRLSIWLAKKGFKVVGLDISQSYLEEALQKADEFDVESNVKFIRGDMRELDEMAGLESPFDCVISFLNSIGWYGEKADELMFTKARRMTRKDGILIIGECDHTGQLMLNFDKRRVMNYEKAIVISEANMDWISGTFSATFRYYAKEGDHLKYVDSSDYQTRIYSVSELSSLLERAGWEVIGAYENIQTLESFTGNAIFKGSHSMNIVAKAV